MSVFDAVDFREHEQVSFFHDRKSGLKAIIAIHTTRPTKSGARISGGGIRFWTYDNDDDAITDALRLSKGMTYKFALAGVPYGGSKGVILHDPKIGKTDDILRAFGRAIESFGGRYIAGPDVGTTPQDMAIIAQETDHVRGQPSQSGDTSPATGYGVFHALRAAVQTKLGRSDLTGLRVGIQGCGGVGRSLAQHLHDAGAVLSVADVNDDAVKHLVNAYGAAPVSPDDILFQDLDVISPCALGAVLNNQSIPNIKAGIICGGANNQLAEDRHGAQLAARDILYVPDYVASAGGLMNATREGSDYDQTDALAAVAKIYDTVMGVFERAARDNVPTNQAADQLAEEIFLKDVT